MGKLFECIKADGPLQNELLKAVEARLLSDNPCNLDLGTSPEVQAAVDKVKPLLRKILKIVDCAIVALDNNAVDSLAQSAADYVNGVLDTLCANEAVRIVDLKRVIACLLPSGLTLNLTRLQKCFVRI